MKKIRAKLASNAGESIGETLVALLIGSLALVMLAGAVSSGTRVILRSKEKIEEYYRENNRITSMNGTADDLTVTLKTTLSGADGEGGESNTVLLTDGVSPLNAKAYTNSVFDNNKVISYSYSGG